MEFFWGPMLGDDFTVSAKVEESKYLFKQLTGSELLVTLLSMLQRHKEKDDQ